MATPDTLRYTKFPLADGSGAIPALGFGTLIPDPLATKQATKTALEVGFRHFDCAERYRNEKAVGDAMQEVFKAGTIRREDVFVTTKLWNNNHRPDRVKPAFEASRQRLRLDYIDCYLIHTPFAARSLRGRSAIPESQGSQWTRRWRRQSRANSSRKC
jgi:diketogulonate reductase-like aldo/keto reductase